MKKLFSTIVTIFSISILFISCKEENNPVVTPTEKQFSAEMQSMLEAALDKAMLENHIPGVIVGVWIPGEGSWVKAKGLSNIATDEPMKLENHFRMGSVTKTFTGTVVLKLVEQGKINLDSSLAYYLPQYNFQKADKITVRYLGNMRAGILSYSDDLNWYNSQVACNFEKYFTADSLVKIALSYPTYFEQGSKHYYCNTNTVLLGMICEKVTGKPISQLLKEMIFDPYGLSNTSWPNSRFLPIPFSHGYTNKTSSGQLHDLTFMDPSWADAAGILVSNLADMKNYIKLLGTGGFYSAAMHTERMKLIDDYGFAITSGNGWIGHTGAVPGFTTGAFYNPAKDAVLIVNVNSNMDNPQTGLGPSDAICESLMNILAPATGVSKLKIKWLE